MSAEQHDDRKRPAARKNGKDDKLAEGGKKVAEKVEAHVGKEAHSVANEVWQGGEAVINDASQLVASLRRGHQELGEKLTQNAESRPYAAVGAAAAVGFVLGGGLTFALTRKLVAVGSRFVVSMAVRKVMDNAGQMLS